MKFSDLGIRRLSIEISTTCNTRCTFCPIDLRGAESEFLPPEKIKPLLDQLAEDGSLEHVTFQFLNEPLLHPKIEELLNYAHGVGLRSLISTNGTILNERILNLLVRTSPSLLKISVQDVNPDTFKVVKGTKMDISEFKRRIANLIRLRLNEPAFKSRLELDVAVPVRDGSAYSAWFRKRGWIEKLLGVAFTDQTINDADSVLLGHMKDFLKYLEKEAGAKIDWDRVVPDLMHTKTWDRDYLPTARIGPNINLELKSFNDWIGIDQHKPITYGSCARLNHVVINYHGDFQLWCSDTHGKTAIGNVFRDKIKDILSRPDGLAKILRAPGFELPTEHCRSCLGASTTRGVAFLNLKNLYRNGSPKFMPEADRDTRASLERLQEQEHYSGHPQIAEAIGESLQRKQAPGRMASPP